MDSSNAMMFSALALAAGIVATPPVAVTVAVAREVPPTVVKIALNQANIIWRRAGVTFDWRFDSRDAADHVLSNVRIHPLCVAFDSDAADMKDHLAVIGWILFDAAGVPENEIHVSYANALALLRETYSAGTVQSMTILERDTLTGRALGRALAHELGHYLMASKTHTQRGIMKTRRPATEMFGPDVADFAVDASQRSLVIARVSRIENVARAPQTLQSPSSQR